MNNKYKVLVVEDEQNICTLVATMLESTGYQVVTAGSCASGKTMYFSYQPDLVLLDLGLPDQDGLELLQVIRADSLTPVIVLSARNDEGAASSRASARVFSTSTSAFAMTVTVAVLSN